MGVTSIEWTDVSWPVVNGCRRISPGCGGKSGEGGCYAERLAATRLSKTAKYRGLAVYGQNGPRWTGATRLWLPDLDMPLRLKKPSRIFVADMGDLFYERVTNEEIAAVFGVMAEAPRHTFQVLTKRPERMLEWFKWIEAKPTGLQTIPTAPRLECAVEAQRMLEDWKPRRWTVSNPKDGWPLPNVHIGVSVEDQQHADERIPLLLQTPAALRFLSVEPLLEAVQLKQDWLLGKFLPGGVDSGAIRGPKVDWVIVGGESGPGARPCHVDWIRSVAWQCADAGVPAFVKQLGARPLDNGKRIRLQDPKGGDMAEWPNWLRVREFPR